MTFSQMLNKELALPDMEKIENKAQLKAFKRQIGKEKRKEAK